MTLYISQGLLQTCSLRIAFDPVIAGTLRVMLFVHHIELGTNEHVGFSRCK